LLGESCEGSLHGSRHFYGKDSGALFFGVAGEDLHGILAKLERDEGLFGAQAGTARARNDEGPYGLAGPHFAVVSGAPEAGNKGQDQVSGGKTRALIDALGLIPALDELAFYGIAFFVVVGEGTDLKPGKFFTEPGGRCAIGKPSGEDRGKQGTIGRIEAKQLTLILMEDGLGKLVPGCEVDMGRPFVGMKPEVGDSGPGNTEHVAGSHRDIRGGAEDRLADGEDLPLLPVDEAEAAIEFVERGAFEPVPYGIHGFGAQRGSPGGDPLSLLLEKGEVFGTSHFEATHPAGSLAPFGGTSPLDSSAS
jgi:hypothetical protein